MGSKDSSKTRKSIKVLRIVFVLIVSLAVALIFVKTRPRPKQKIVENLGPLVEVVEVRKASLPMIIEAYGTVRSGENLSLTAEVSGKIVKTAPGLEEGAYFSKGAFLMRIDPRNYRLNVELLQSEASALEAELGRLAQERRNLQATLKIAKEDLDLVKAEYDRTLSLGTRKVVSQKELDQGRQKWLLSSQRAQEIKNSLALIKPRMDVLKAQRQSIKVRLKEADLALKRTEIRTPFVCRIADKLVETGQYVKVGSVLANIYNVGLMEVEVRIPPRDLRWLEIGPSGRPDRLKNPQVRARVMYDSSGENLVWDGLVSRVKGRMEENTRTLPIVVEVRNSHPGPGHPILPGMFVKVKIIGQKMHDLFLLPAGAVREGGAVYVVRNGKIEVKSVKILRRVGNQVYVTGGLSDGDQVITLFPGTALEGMKVRVRNRRTQPQKH